MIIPLKTALPVSQRIDGDDFGESFISRKDAHSLLIRLSNSGSLRRDVLKRHMVMGLYGRTVFHVNVTGLWSLINMGWIIEYKIFDIIELLVRKKSIREYDL